MPSSILRILCEATSYHHICLLANTTTTGSTSQNNLPTAHPLPISKLVCFPNYPSKAMIGTCHLVRVTLNTGERLLCGSVVIILIGGGIIHTRYINELRRMNPFMWGIPGAVAALCWGVFAVKGRRARGGIRPRTRGMRGLPSRDGNDGIGFWMCFCLCSWMLGSMDRWFELMTSLSSSCVRYCSKQAQSSRL